MSETTTTTPPLQDAFSLPFKDENWIQKALIGSALVLANFIIPLVPLFFLLGYFYRIMNRVANEKNGYVLPEWDDWGGLFVDGLKYFGAVFVFMLPGFLLVGLGYGAMFTMPFFAGLLATLDSNLEGPMAILMMFGSFGGAAFMMLGVFISMALGVVIPPAIAHMSAKNDFAAAFRVGEWWRVLRANFGGFLIVYILLLGLSWFLVFVFQFLYLSIIFCCLVPFVMCAVNYFIGVISANLFGQTYLDGKNKVGQIVALPAVE